ncbi:MAG: FHA domain-containing protein [Lachnospiraceae bacterium]|nr:FHA domain-containing protein [Lachnospiraceae bacterium]
MIPEQEPQTGLPTGMPPVQREYPPVQPQYQPVTPPPVQPQASQPIPQPAPQPIPQPAYEEPQAYANGQNSYDALGGETTILDSLGGETTILSSSSPVLTGFLRRLSTGELIEIAGSPFRIGREQGSTNYCITDNTAISRNHAVIQIRDGRFFITDLNSSNATYVNGSRLVPGQETEIHSGFLIRLANEDFDFIVQ